MHSHTWQKYVIFSEASDSNTKIVQSIKSSQKQMQPPGSRRKIPKKKKNYPRGQGARKCCSLPKAAAKRALLEAPRAALSIQKSGTTNHPRFVVMSFAVRVKPFKNDGKSTKKHPKKRLKKKSWCRLAQCLLSRGCIHILNSLD